MPLKQNQSIQGFYVTNTQRTNERNNNGGGEREMRQTEQSNKQHSSKQRGLFFSQKAQINDDEGGTVLDINEARGGVEAIITRDAAAYKLRNISRSRHRQTAPACLSSHRCYCCSLCVNEERCWWCVSYLWCTELATRVCAPTNHRGASYPSLVVFLAGRCVMQVMSWRGRRNLASELLANTTAATIIGLVPTRRTTNHTHSIIRKTPRWINTTSDK